MTFPLFLPAVLSVCACGGRNAGELMKRYPAANLTAIDYSPLSVETAGSSRCSGDFSSHDAPNDMEQKEVVKSEHSEQIGVEN